MTVKPTWADDEPGHIYADWMEGGEWSNSRLK